MVQKTTDPKRRSGEPGAASRQLLQQLESSLQKHWRLGQNMVLCWAPDPRGVLTLMVPHYFLGNRLLQTGMNRGTRRLSSVR